MKATSNKSKKSVKSTQQEEKSQAKSEHAMIPVWIQHLQKVPHPSLPEDLLSWNSVWYTLGAQWWLYIHNKRATLHCVVPAEELDGETYRQMI